MTLAQKEKLEKKCLTTPDTQCIIYEPCRCGGIGRRKGLKIPRWQHRTGSSPVTGTNTKYSPNGGYYFFKFLQPTGVTGVHRAQPPPAADKYISWSPKSKTLERESTTKHLNCNIRICTQVDLSISFEKKRLLLLGELVCKRIELCDVGVV